MKMVKMSRYVLVKPRNPEAIAEGAGNVYKGGVEDKRKKIFNWDGCVGRYLDAYRGVLE